jgi:hypothetical protein
VAPSHEGAQEFRDLVGHRNSPADAGLRRLTTRADDVVRQVDRLPLKVQRLDAQPSHMDVDGSVIATIAPDDPMSILDFACGNVRALRWLDGAFPDTK